MLPSLGSDWYFVGGSQRCWMPYIVWDSCEKWRHCSSSVTCKYPLKQRVPTHFGIRGQFHGRQIFSWTRVKHKGMLSGWFKCITFIVHFISIMITTAPNSDHQALDLEVADPALEIIGSQTLLLLFSCSVISNSLRSHGLQCTWSPCPSPSPGACSNSCPLSQWCHPTILSSVVPFSCLQSFPCQHS